MSMLARWLRIFWRHSVNEEVAVKVRDLLVHSAVWFMDCQLHHRWIIGIEYLLTLRALNWCGRLRKFDNKRRLRRNVWQWQWEKNSLFSLEWWYSIHYSPVVIFSEFTKTTESSLTFSQICPMAMISFCYGFRTFLIVTLSRSDLAVYHSDMHWWLLLLLIFTSFECVVKLKYSTIQSLFGNRHDVFAMGAVASWMRLVQVVKLPQNSWRFTRSCRSKNIGKGVPVHLTVLITKVSLLSIFVSCEFCLALLWCFSRCLLTCWLNTVATVYRKLKNCQSWRKWVLVLTYHKVLLWSHWQVSHFYSLSICFVHDTCGFGPREQAWMSGGVWSPLLWFGFGF